MSIAPIPCILIDDEPLALSLLNDYIEKTAGLQLVFETTKAAEAITQVQQGFSGLVFLDVQMPELSGIDFLRRIQGSAAKVILTTAYPQYALEGFEHDVVDYLLKPITFERFTMAVHKARSRFFKPEQSEQADHLFVKVEYRLQKITFSSILYMEGLRDYIAFHTTSGKILSLENLKSMEAVLPARFIRIHKSFIINSDHIDYLERGRIVINKQYLPVGDTYKEKVMKQLGL